MHFPQHKLCTRKTELAPEMKCYLYFHRVTWPYRTLTNGSDVKYVPISWTTMPWCQQPEARESFCSLPVLPTYDQQLQIKRNIRCLRLVWSGGLLVRAIIREILSTHNVALCNTRVALCNNVSLQSVTAISLQSATIVITKCDRYFITKCDKRYYKVWQLFHYKVRQALLQSATGIWKCDVAEKYDGTLIFPALGFRHSPCYLFVESSTHDHTVRTLMNLCKASYAPACFDEQDIALLVDPLHKSDARLLLPLLHCPPNDIHGLFFIFCTSSKSVHHVKSTPVRETQTCTHTICAHFESLLTENSPDSGCRDIM